MEEMKGITMIDVLHTRAEGIMLLRSKIPKQFQ